MKKSVFILLFVFILLVIVGCFVYKNNTIKETNEVFLNSLNGVELYKTDSMTKVESWCFNYQKQNFVSDDTLFLLLSDVELFNSEIEGRLKYSEERKNNLFDNDAFEGEVPPNLEGLNTTNYGKYFSIEKLEKDPRVILKDNNYYIKVSDLDFYDSNLEYITYEHFHRSIDKVEVGKETFSQRQAANRFESLGYYKEGSSVFFKYFDKEEKETVTIEVKYFYGFFVEYCKMV